MNSKLSYSLETLNSGQNQQFFVPCDLVIWWRTLKNNRAPLLYYIKLCASFKAMGEFELEYSPEALNLGQNLWFFFVPCDLEIWWVKLKNNRVPLLCCFKDCASFHSHLWIQTGLTALKGPIWVKINSFLSHVTLKFDRWTWKTIGHLFYATSSIVHYFVAIGGFKLKLESGNAKFGSKLTSFVHHFIIICEFKLKLRSRNGWFGFWPLWPWSLTSDLDLSHGHNFCHC